MWVQPRCGHHHGPEVVLLENSGHPLGQLHSHVHVCDTLPGDLGYFNPFTRLSAGLTRSLRGR